MRENFIPQEAINPKLEKAQLSSKLEYLYNKLDELYQEKKISDKAMEDYKKLIQKLLKINSSQEMDNTGLKNSLEEENILVEMAKKDLKSAVKILAQNIEYLTKKEIKAAQSKQKKSPQTPPRKNDPDFFVKIIPQSNNPLSKSNNMDTPIL